MARGGCGAGITRHHRIPICVARHKENVTEHSRTAVRRDSCSSGALPRNAKSFAPLRGKPPYGAPKRKQCKKVFFCRSGRSRYNFTKTKVLKRKRQKIHISKHRIPICVARHKETKKNLTRGGCGVGITRHCRIPFCVARHKENVTDRSRTTVRRDSCSSGATYPIKRGAAGCSKTVQKKDDVRDGSTKCARHLCSRGDRQRSFEGQNDEDRGLIRGGKMRKKKRKNSLDKQKEQVYNIHIK